MSELIYHTNPAKKLRVDHALIFNVELYYPEGYQMEGLRVAKKRRRVDGWGAVMHISSPSLQNPFRQSGSPLQLTAKRNP